MLGNLAELHTIGDSSQTILYLLARRKFCPLAIETPED